MQTKGLFWHVHHGELVEYCWNAEERIAYIRENKPSDERELRLRLLKPVRNVPAKLKAACAARGKASVAYDKAYAAFDKAYAAFDKARAVRDKARAVRDKARAVRDKARAARDKARAARDKARAAQDKAGVVWNVASAAYSKALEEAMSELEALHREQCPDCPWNGETIFPGG